VDRVTTILSGVVFRSCSDGDYRDSREWVSSAHIAADSDWKK